MAEQKVRLFVDMDGTLAQFQKVTELEDLYRPGYFRSLKPQQSVVYAAGLLCRCSQQVEVFILSAVLSDSGSAREEKNAWLDQYLPVVDAEHRIFLPCGKEKAAYVPNGVGPQDFLLDDYTANLNDWVQQGGRGIKLLNGINHTLGSWKQSKVRFDREPSQLSYELLCILQRGALIQDDKPLPELEKYTAAMEKLGYEPSVGKEPGNDLLVWKECKTGRFVGLGGLQGVKDFLKEKNRQRNAGYEIVQSIQTDSHSYVLGQCIKYPDRFVTWCSRDGQKDYYYGRYFEDRLAAQQDLFKRALEDVQDEIEICQKENGQASQPTGSSGSPGQKTISAALNRMGATALETPDFEPELEP